MECPLHSPCPLMVTIPPPTDFFFFLTGKKASLNFLSVNSSTVEFFMGWWYFSHPFTRALYSNTRILLYVLFVLNISQMCFLVIILLMVFLMYKSWQFNLSIPFSLGFFFPFNDCFFTCLAPWCTMTSIRTGVLLYSSLCLQHLMEWQYPEKNHRSINPCQIAVYCIFLLK